MKRLHTIVSAVFAGAVCAGLVGTFGSCASTPDPNRVTVIATPSFTQFTGDANNVGVSAFIEKRCGTLDCHGQVGRPLRIYGQRGLRILNDAENYPGNDVPTTPDELLANFQSVVGLEPETMSNVVQFPAQYPPTDLLFIKKPELLESHKGGQQVIPGDDGDTCLKTWVEGMVNATACGNALAVQ